MTRRASAPKRPLTPDEQEIDQNKLIYQWLWKTRAERLSKRLAEKNAAKGDTA